MTSSEDTDDEELFEDGPVHPFLTDIVIETLKVKQKFLSLNVCDNLKMKCYLVIELLILVVKVSTNRQIRFYQKIQNTS